MFIEDPRNELQNRQQSTIFCLFQQPLSNLTPSFSSQNMGIRGSVSLFIYFRFTYVVLHQLFFSFFFSFSLLFLFLFFFVNCHTQCPKKIRNNIVQTLLVCLFYHLLPCIEEAQKEEKQCQLNLVLDFLIKPQSKKVTIFSQKILKSFAFGESSKCRLRQTPLQSLQFQ